MSVSASFVVVSSVRALSLVAARAGSSGRVASVVVGVLVPAGLLASAVGAPAVVRSWCVAWRVLVGRAGLALLARCGPRVGFLRRAAPLFRQIPHSDSIIPIPEAQRRRPLRRDPACGQQKLDRCGGTNREEYLSAKGDWQSAAMPTIKALTKPQGYANGCRRLFS